MSLESLNVPSAVVKGGSWRGGVDYAPQNAPIDPLPDFASCIDHALRVEFVSPAAIHWLAQPSAQIVGRFVSEIVGSRRFSLFSQALQRALSGRSVALEVRWPDGNGCHRVADVHCLPRQDPWGCTNGLYLFAIDVTTRRADETLRQQAMDDLAVQLLEVQSALARERLRRVR